MWFFRSGFGRLVVSMKALLLGGLLLGGLLLGGLLLGGPVPALTIQACANGCVLLTALVGPSLNPRAAHRWTPGWPTAELLSIGCQLSKPCDSVVHVIPSHLCWGAQGDMGRFFCGDVGRWIAWFATLLRTFLMSRSVSCETSLVSPTRILLVSRHGTTRGESVFVRFHIREQSSWEGSFAW